VSKLKVGYIGQRGVPPLYSGVERYVDEIVRRLPKDEVESYTYCRPEFAAEHADYTTRLYKSGFGTLGLETFTYSFMCAIDALKHPFDVIHFQAFGPSLFSCIPKIRGTKIVATVHGIDWQRAKWGKAAKFAIKSGDHMIRHSASAIISVSKNFKQQYEDLYRSEVFFVPIGVSDPKIVPINKIHTKFGLKPQKYILFLSRLVPEKGIHYLIEAFRNIKRDDFSLVIAGGSPPQDKYTAQLKQMAGDGANVVFTDFVSREEVHELYSNAYLFVLPSDLEGMPAVVLEALSHRCPALVSDIQENLDVIEGEDRSYGFVHKAQDVADLQKQLTYLLDNPEIVDELRDPGYENIKKNHSWDNSAKMTYDVYKYVMES